LKVEFKELTSIQSVPEAAHQSSVQIEIILVKLAVLKVEFKELTSIQSVPEAAHQSSVQIEIILVTSLIYHVEVTHH
jgi:hypothetical protein